MKMQFRAFFVVLLFGVLSMSGMSFGSFSFADTLGDVQDKLDALQEKQAAYKKMVTLKESQTAIYTLQIASISQQVDKFSSSIGENEKKLQETNQKITVLVSQISEKEKIIADQKNILADFIRSSYDLGLGKIGSIIFSDVSEGNPFASEDQSVQFQEKVSEMVEKIESLRKSLDRDRESLQKNKTETETLNEKLQQQTAYLEGTKQQKQTLVVQTTAEKEQYQKKLSTIEKQIQDVEQEIESLEADKSNGLDLSTLPDRADAAMGYPVKAGTMTQGYGKTSFAKSSGMYKSGFHNGVDFGVPVGTEVLAAAGGVVTAIGDCGRRYAYGKWIAIDHGNGLVTLYGHLSKQTVKKGDTVSRGESIGLSGNTGNSTGPHVHFTVFSESSFEVVDSKSVSGLKIPTGAHVSPLRYL